MICARRTVGRLHGPCRRAQESKRDESERWPRMAMHVSLRHRQDLQIAYCLTTTRSHQPTHAKMNRLPDEGETVQDHSEEASEQTLPVGIDQIAPESRGALEMECRYRTLDGAGDAHNFVGRPRTLLASNGRPAAGPDGGATSDARVRESWWGEMRQARGMCRGPESLTD